MDKTKLITDLSIDEGIKLFPYTDTVGKTSIGTGRNLTDRGISQAESNFMLSNDINMVVTQLNKSLPWWVTLSEPRQRVLCNMCFNLGISKLLSFANTLSFIKTGDYEHAAQEMLNSTWAKQVGKRAQRLAQIMREG